VDTDQRSLEFVMTRRTDAHPTMIRPEVGAPFFSTWRVGTPERQKETVEAIAATWERRAWPAEGLLGYHVYTGEDGTTLLHHSQWRSEQDYEAFVKVHRQERVDEVDVAVPGIERVGLGRYRRYRSGAQEAETRIPGCVVIVEIEFEGPDPDRQRAWVDAVFEALESEPEPQSRWDLRPLPPEHRRHEGPQLRRVGDGAGPHRRAGRAGRRGRIPYARVGARTDIPRAEAVHGPPLHPRPRARPRVITGTHKQDTRQATPNRLDKKSFR
jgi:heme-degrading monooxygenase HmoA